MSSSLTWSTLFAGSAKQKFPDSPSQVEATEHKWVWTQTYRLLDELEALIEPTVHVINRVKFPRSIPPGRGKGPLEHITTARYFQNQSEPSWLIGDLFMEYIPRPTLEDLDLSALTISLKVRQMLSQSYRAMVTGYDILAPIAGSTYSKFARDDT
ncbi:hypothetical protein CIHG_03380 [Coccidioides immitis H538.4]|uniref:Uncharacterized protein n=3 Tax=Coccidioides immitis TaxID=5501 RepID=A0A0J8R2Q2_COCIT|nr:hypothetical protein CIRG_08733 [Coccidioides immitis RMSCC 2394]KMU77973.1 hypothetical protein CISG_06883 [Coccidioides immitis RMSCC 3703]KMU85852.1 hypothetical protein CIHG_03380 [Coccidioides immitis H538.4]